MTIGKAQDFYTPSAIIAKVSTIALLGAVAAYLAEPLFDPALWGHLTRGRWIIFNGTVPHSDLWSAAGYGKPWVDNSYLFDIIVGTLFKWGGERALAAAHLFSVALLLCSLSWACSARANNVFFGTLLAIVAVAGVTSVISFCPTLPALGLMVVVLELSLRARASDRREEEASLVVAQVVLSQIASLAVAAAFLGALLAGRFRILILLGASLALTPYWGRTIVQAVMEFQRTLEFGLVLGTHLNSLYHYDFALLLLLAAIYLLLHLNSGAKFSRRDLLLVLLACSLALLVRGFTPVSIVLVAFTTAEAVGRGEAENRILRGAALLQQRLMKLPVLGVLWLCCCVAIVNVVSLFQTPVIRAHLPVEAALLLEQQRLDGPVLIPAEFGAYLTHRFSDGGGTPQKFAYVDERSRVLALRDAIMVQMLFAVDAPTPQLLRELPIGSVVCPTDAPICELLRRDPGWQLLGEATERSRWVAFLRSTGRNSPI